MARERKQLLAEAIIAGIVRFNPSYFAFLSGIVVSISINLITDLAFGSPHAELKSTEWLVAGTFFIASLAFAVLASDLDRPHQHWVVYWRDTKDHYGLEEKVIIQGAIQSKLTIITVELILGLMASTVGLVLLAFSALTH
jgi:hypothetical protein